MRTTDRPPAESLSRDALASWGLRTVTFALTIRAIDAGEPPDEPRAAMRLLTEAQAVVDDLWTEALAACARADLPNAREEQFLRLVLGWCGGGVGGAPSMQAEEG